MTLQRTTELKKNKRQKQNTGKTEKIKSRKSYNEEGEFIFKLII